MAVVLLLVVIAFMLLQRILFRESK
jgi:hypothetical protein